MAEDIKWIEAVKSQIVSDDDKVLFNEAAECYLRSLYRASYIITWITLAESLKRKIKEFSNLGDTRAQAASQKIEDAENQKLSADKIIYEEAKNCGIIDNADYSKISFLWEQRCLFAHPYNTSPGQDEVKHIIGQTIRISLGRELQYNKTYLEDLVKNISSKPFFLSSDVVQIKEYANRIIARTPAHLHPFLFKTLLYEVGSIQLLDDKIYEIKKLRFFIVELLANSPMPLEKPDWSLENRVVNYPYTCFIGFVHYRIWDKLPVRIKDLLIAYFETEQNEKQLVHIKFIMSGIIEKNKLEDRYSDRYIKKLDHLDFESSIHFYGSPKNKFRRIYDDLSTSKFSLQNPIIDFIKTDDGLELISKLEKEDQFMLGRQLKSRATYGHWKSQYLLESVYNLQTSPSDWLKAGISFASFVDMTDKVKLDEKNIDKSIKILNLSPVEIQDVVYKLMMDTIDKNTPDSLDKMVFGSDRIQKIKESIIELLTDWNEKSLTNFNALFKKLEIYFA